MRIGISIECAVCHRTKKPRGRSAPLEMSLCNHECLGYNQEPFVGDLWPRESEKDFGYPVSSHGTREVNNGQET
jgi:hypothetical protein